MAVAWNDDPPGSEPQIAANVASILRGFAAAALARRAPTVAMAQEWHREIYRAVPLPVPYYAGEIRDSDPRFPELDRYEVVVGGLAGAPAATVPQELRPLRRHGPPGAHRPRQHDSGRQRAGRAPAAAVRTHSLRLTARRVGTNPPVREWQRTDRPPVGELGCAALRPPALRSHQAAPRGDRVCARRIRLDAARPPGDDRGLPADAPGTHGTGSIGAARRIAMRAKAAPRVADLRLAPRDPRRTLLSPSGV